MVIGRQGDFLSYACSDCEQDNLKVLVSCHKECAVPDDSMYLSLHEGHAVSDKELGMQPDDSVLGQSPDNIRALNGIYCEMIAMYWAWKNISELYRA